MDLSDCGLDIRAYEENFVVDGRAALYWKRHRYLIVSDLHLGKSMHFRKKGLAVPAGIDENDLEKLNQLIQEYKPNKIILLGDLFHSSYNSDWEKLANFSMKFRKGLFLLVKGNHDILNEWHYGRGNFSICDEFKKGRFLFTHHPMKLDKKDERINVCGHIHPGVKLYGKARQSLRLPAFFFRVQHIMMPAYGRFTGSVNIKPKSTDRIFALVKQRIHEIPAINNQR